MREIVSLAPNVSSIINQLGGTDVVYGTTKHTDYGRDLGGWLTPDYAEISSVDPDFVFTYGKLQEEVKEDLEKMGVKVRHYDYNEFSELFTLIEEIAKEINAQERGSELNRQLVRRVHKVKEFVQDKERPTVYCEEWDSPPMVAGNWIPEMVETAGGKYPFLEYGERSRCIKRGEFDSHDVDVVISHLCNEGLMQEFRSFRNEWDFPRETYFVHDNYMNQLSPRTVTGIENIADVLHNYRATSIHYKRRE